MVRWVTGVGGLDVEKSRRKTSTYKLLIAMACAIVKTTTVLTEFLREASSAKKFLTVVVFTVGKPPYMLLKAHMPEVFPVC